MNLRNLIASLKAAVEAGDWIAVASLAADAIKVICGPPVAMAAGPGGGHEYEVDFSGLEAAVTKAKAAHGKVSMAPAATAGGNVAAGVGAIDPSKWLALVSMVIEILKMWQAK